MKMSLDQRTVAQLRLNRMPVPGTKPLQWAECKDSNYLLYDTHADAPAGFAIRVGKKSSTYLIDKMVDGKKMKIRVGLAWGKKGAEAPISLEAAREKGVALLGQAFQLKGNPNTIKKEKEASQLTLDEVWDRYINGLKTRGRPAKPNSLLSVDKARQKLAHLKDRTVNSISAREVLAVFDLHAFERGHPTAAEAMGRWATAAVKAVIDRETHEALGQGRAPTITHNPFLVLKIEKKYRSSRDLEISYENKKIRNPLSFSKTVVPFLNAAWSYRRSNGVAADLFILSMLWGLRAGEASSLQWFDRVKPSEVGTARWIDLEAGLVCITDQKNGTNHKFPIGPCALELLKLRRSLVPANVPWVFPSRSIKSATGHYSDFSQAIKTVKSLMNQTIEPGDQVTHLRGHDFRRTFGAACEKLGFSDRQTKRMLGHSIGGGETVNRYTEPELKDMVARMKRVETLMLKDTAEIYDALRPGGVKNIKLDDLVVPRA